MENDILIILKELEYVFVNSYILLFLLQYGGESVDNGVQCRVNREDYDDYLGINFGCDVNVYKCQEI